MGPSEGHRAGFAEKVERLQRSASGKKVGKNFRVGLKEQGGNRG